jgi:hypothetical protein
LFVQSLQQRAENATQYTAKVDDNVPAAVWRRFDRVFSNHANSGVPLTQVKLRPLFLPTLSTEPVKLRLADQARLPICSGPLSSGECF